MGTELKFCNIKYYIGGGKTPRRVRFNQNFSIHVHRNDQKWLLKKNDKWLIDNLGYITNFRVVSTSTTTLKRIAI